MSNATRLADGSGARGAGSAVSALRIGIVIPAYNESRNLGPLLDFLRSYELASAQRPLSRAIWVAGSGSTDASPAIARDYARRWSAVRVRDTGRREGLLLALDGLLQLAEGDLILRMDADVRLTPEGLDALIARIRGGEFGIVGGRIVPAASPSVWVRHLSRAEYDLHHRVSLQRPKTTVVQLFRRSPVSLRPDAGVEDQELQDQVVERCGPAGYVPQAVVTVVPPANLRDFLFQRIRTIEHLKAHRARGYGPVPTDSLRSVGAALLGSVRAREVGPLDLAAFFVVESWARVATAYHRLRGRARTFQWEPIADTKQPVWTIASSPANTRPSEDPVPMLAR